MKNKTILQRGVTHPQIHLDYYKWLGEMQKDDFNKRFMEQYSKDFQSFHAIAMWVWSVSRETLANEQKEFDKDNPNWFIRAMTKLKPMTPELATTYVPYPPPIMTAEMEARYAEYSPGEEERMRKAEEKRARKLKQKAI